MNEIVKVDLSQFGLEENKAAEIRKDFDAVLKIATELEGKLNEVVAKEITKDVCKEAKTLLNKFVKVRTGIAKVHKERKSFYLSGGRAVDGLKNAYTHAVEGYESQLKQISTHFETIEAERIAKLQAERAEKLSVYVDDANERDLAKFADDEFEALLAMKKRQREDQIAAEKKVEADRIAAEEADAAERKRISDENAQLKAKAEETARLAKIEADKRAKDEADRVAKDKAESDRVEAERAKERKEAQDKLDAAEKETARLAKESADKAEALAKEVAGAEAREKNTANRKRVNNAALSAIVLAMSDKHSGNIDEAKAIAKDIVTAIAKGDIPNVSISY